MVICLQSTAFSPRSRPLPTCRAKTNANTILYICTYIYIYIIYTCKHTLRTYVYMYILMPYNERCHHTFLGTQIGPATGRRRTPGGHVARV